MSHIFTGLVGLLTVIVVLFAAMAIFGFLDYFLKISAIVFLLTIVYIVGEIAFDEFFR